jgi:hypothetical protein
VIYKSARRAAVTFFFFRGLQILLILFLSAVVTEALVGALSG